MTYSSSQPKRNFRPVGSRGSLTQHPLLGCESKPVWFAMQHSDSQSNLFFVSAEIRT